jgi:hypothetical protein
VVQEGQGDFMAIFRTSSLRIIRFREELRLGVMLGSASINDLD